MTEYTIYINRHGNVRAFCLKIFEKYIKQQKFIGERHIRPGWTYSQTITFEIANRIAFISFIEHNLYVFAMLSFPLCCHVTALSF